MTIEPTRPLGLVEARRTPLLDVTSLPEPLARSHRTTVWGELHVQSGGVRYVDLEGDDRRDVRVEAGEWAVIEPDVEHAIEPSTDATFFIQFFREPDAPLVPGTVEEAPPRRSGPWEHRGRDLDAEEEILELVTRQYVDVVQDDLLQPYFTFGPDFIDWKGHIQQVADYWCHVLLYTPGYEIDTIENHRRLHEHDAFTPELFDRWLGVFVEAVDGGWSGPNAHLAKRRATGMARAMANRFLGKGAWRPADDPPTAQP